MGIYALLFAYKITNSDHTDFISLHISNFAITGLIMSVELFKSVKRGEYSISDFRALVLISITLNILVESVNIGNIKLPLNVTFVDFNTADPIDALFGVLAVLLFVLVIAFCSKTNVKQKKYSAAQ